MDRLRCFRRRAPVAAWRTGLRPGRGAGLPGRHSLRAGPRPGPRPRPTCCRPPPPRPLDKPPGCRAPIRARRALGPGRCRWPAALALPAGHTAVSALAGALVVALDRRCGNLHGSASRPPRWRAGHDGTSTYFFVAQSSPCYENGRPSGIRQVLATGDSSQNALPGGCLCPALPRRGSVSQPRVAAQRLPGVMGHLPIQL